MVRAHRAACALAWAVCASVTTAAHGQAAASPPIDRTVVRFYAPETGGTAYPRFIFARVLAFESRLLAMADAPEGLGESYGEREARDAIEHHVAEEMLSSLADRLIADSAPDRRPSAHDLSEIEREVVLAFVEELGGHDRIERAARAEQIDNAEVEAILRRGALAAWYIDRALAPILRPSEQQLRDVFRTSAHPYHGRPFEQVRASLGRWFIVERVRVTESAFLQAARSRVQIIVTR